MPSAPEPTTNPPQFETTEDTGERLTLTFSGRWTLDANIPDPAPIRASLQKRPPKQLALVGQAITAWDSALLGFLLPVVRDVQQQKLSLDSSGLPEGAQRLLTLAAAEPEKVAVHPTVVSEGAFTEMARLSERAVGEIKRELGFLGEVTLALWRMVRGRSQLRPRDLFLQLQECGAEALPIVMLIGFLVGAIIGFVGATVLETYGAAIFTANMVAIAITRELGPLMTAIILSGRTGAAFAANLGTMRTNEEIDALQTVGLEPVDFLVLPRVLALALMIPLLSAFADLAGIVGGMLVATNLPNVTFTAYIHATLKSLTLTQIFIGLSKSVLFGVIISLVGCRRGLECGRSAAAVGLAATSAVVVSISLVIALDGLVAVVCNALKI